MCCKMMLKLKMLQVLLWFFTTNSSNSTLQSALPSMKSSAFHFTTSLGFCLGWGMASLHSGWTIMLKNILQTKTEQQIAGETPPYQPWKWQSGLRWSGIFFPCLLYNLKESNGLHWIGFQSSIKCLNNTFSAYHVLVQQVGTSTVAELTARYSNMFTLLQLWRRGTELG